MDIPIDDHLPDEDGMPLRDHDDILDEHHDDAHVSDEDDDDIEEDDIELQDTTNYRLTTITTTPYAPLRGSRHPDLPSDLLPEPDTP
jgi:hypothetical protein